MGMSARVQRKMAAEVPQKSPNRSKTALVSSPAVAAEVTKSMRGLTWYASLRIRAQQLNPNA